jgi:hypothetical protein
MQNDTTVIPQERGNRLSCIDPCYSLSAECAYAISRACSRGEDYPKLVDTEFVCSG